MSAQREEEAEHAEKAEEWRALGNVIDRPTFLLGDGQDEFVSSSRNDDALGNVNDRLTFVMSVIVLVSLCIWMMVQSSQSGTHEQHGAQHEETAVSPADH